MRKRNYDESTNPSNGWRPPEIAVATRRPQTVEPTLEKRLLLDYYEMMHGLVKELKRRGYSAHVEGGGSGCVFVWVDFPNERVACIGNANDTWGADLYAKQEDFENGDSGEGVETAVARHEIDPGVIVDAFDSILRKAATD